MKSTWPTLNRIQLSLGLDDHRMAELMHLTCKELRRKRTLNEEPSALHVNALLKEIHVSFERFLDGTLDYRALMANFFKTPGYLPERYATGAFSKRRTSINVLSYLQSFRSWEEMHYALQHLQVREDLFASADEKISIHFLSDLCTYLAQQGYPESTFHEMGAYSTVTNLHSDLGRVLQAQETPRRLYEKMLSELIQNFDENYTYRATRMKPGFARVEVRQRPEVAEALRTRVFGNAWVCKVKGAVGASFPAYLSLPHSSVKETRCIHRGDPVCVFEYDFALAEHTLKRRGTRRPSSSVRPPALPSENPR